MALPQPDIQQSAPNGLSMRLEIEPGEPICGRVEIAGFGKPIEFAGWIELMATINHARAGEPF
jgi:hypothetical protein